MSGACTGGALWVRRLFAGPTATINAEAAMATADASAVGFQGHGCVFCGTVIRVEEADQLPITIRASGRAIRCWAHRACFRERAQPHLHANIDRIPPAQ